jgi:hypothetical protein
MIRASERLRAEQISRLKVGESSGSELSLERERPQASKAMER